MSKKQVQLPIAIVNTNLAVWIQQELDDESLEELLDELSGAIRFEFSNPPKQEE